ncbi:MAG: hypothetical protein AAGF13_06530 [Pseudomonadota bacterium]
MRLMSQAVTGQLITYGLAILATIWLPFLLPNVGALFEVPVPAAMGTCALLALCLVGLKFHLVYTIVPLAGLEIQALIKGVAGGYTLSNLPHLILAIFAFVALAAIANRLFARYFAEAARYDVMAYCPCSNTPKTEGARRSARAPRT